MYLGTTIRVEGNVRLARSVSLLFSWRGTAALPEYARSFVLLTFLVAIGIAALARGEDSTSSSPGITVLNSRIRLANAGEQANRSINSQIPPSISAEGRYIAFASDADNLVPNDTNSSSDVFVRDRHQRTTTRISVASDGAEADNNSSCASISADGRYVVFGSNASNLSKETERGIYLHDRNTGETVLVTKTSNFWDRSFQIAASGRFVVYTLKDKPGIWLYDIAKKSREAVIPRQSINESYDRFSIPLISAEGRYVAFFSYQYRDNNRSIKGFQLLDRQRKLSIRITEKNVKHATMTPDGRYVAFSSDLSNLVPRDSNRSSDIFVYDRDELRLTRVSVSSAGIQGAGDSAWPSISADGNRILFVSKAPNLVTPKSTSYESVFLHNRAEATTKRVNLNWDGTEPNDSAWNGSTLSADGLVAIFVSGGGQYVKDDTENSSGSLYAHRLAPSQQRSVELASRNVPHHGKSALANPFDPSEKGVSPPETARLPRLPKSLPEPIALQFDNDVRALTALAYSHDGRLIATSTEDRNRSNEMPYNTRIWNASTGRLVQSIKSKNIVRRLSFPKDGSRVFLNVHNRGELRVHDVHSSRKLTTYTYPRQKGQYRVDGLVFSPDARRFLRAAAYSQLRPGHYDAWDLCETKMGYTLGSFIASSAEITYKRDPGSAAMSPDGKLFAANFQLRSRSGMQIWDVATQKQLSQWPTKSSNSRVEFLPDSQQLVTSYGNKLQVLDALTGRLLREIDYDHSEGVTLSADGGRFAYAGRKQVRVCSLLDGATVLALEHKNPLYVVFAPSGAGIAIGSYNGDVRVWTSDAFNAKLAQKIVNIASNREWSDATGAFTVQADCVAVDKQHLWLRRTDKQPVRVAITSLSEVDQQHAAYLRQRNQVFQQLSKSDGTDRTNITGPQKPLSSQSQPLQPVSESDARNSSIEGEWKVVQYQRDGQHYPSKATTLYEFKAGRVTVKVDGQPSADLHYSLDLSQQPQHLDLILFANREKEVSPMIFQITGDDLVVCYAPPGNDRPSSLLASGRNKNTFIRFRRANTP